MTHTGMASSTQTGSYEIFVQAGPEGSGPPPHSHPWDEAFYVLRGSVDFCAGDLEATARPGTLVHVPGGTTHWFRFGGEGGEMISITPGAGASGLFTDIDRQIAPGNPDLGALVAIAAAHGLTVAPPA